jgi:hypothetical protein
MLALLIAGPARAQEAPFVRPVPGDSASRQIEVPAAGVLHLVLRGRAAPGDVLRVYGPDGALLGEASADGLQDVALDVAAPVVGTYLARDERPAPVPGGGGPIVLAVDFTGRAPSGEDSAQPSTEAATGGGEDTSADGAEPIELPGYAPVGTPTLSLVGLDPAPGTLLRRPACDLIDALRATDPCPPGRTVIGADVTPDFVPGPMLVLIALLDRDDMPAVPGPDPDGGLGGQDARTAIAYLTSPGTVHLATSTTPLYAGAVPRNTRLRVRLCEIPHTIDGVFRLGPCHAEAASDPYPVAPAPTGGTGVQPPRGR